MRVTVRYYGIIGDMAGRKEESVELPDRATVGDLLARLAVANPRFEALAKQVRAVVNGQGATRESDLTDGDEIALLRAIGGGAR